MAYVNRVGTGAGRPISSLYKRRIQKVYSVTRELREEARDDYKKGLRDATKEQLYDVTPLPVTHAMMNSIGARIKGDTVEVGYNIGNYSGRAKHAPFRLNMKGTSVLGGHRLDMNPNRFLRNKVDPKVRRRNARAAQKILEG